LLKQGKNEEAMEQIEQSMAFSIEDEIRRPSRSERGSAPRRNPAPAREGAFLFV
jgi:hypothetical protein